MPCPGDPGPRPTFIPLPDCGRVVMQYTIYGQTVENVFYWNHGSPYDAATIAALALAVQGSWVTNLKPILPPAAVLNSITATATDAASGVQHVAPVGSAGSNAGAGMETIGNTLAIKFGTGVSGRSYRGRMYFPILIEGLVSANVVDLSYAAGLVSAVTAFFQDVETDTGDKHVIASYQNDCAWRATGVSTDVSSYSYVDRNLDSQRRRLSGRGI